MCVCVKMPERDRPIREFGIHNLKIEMSPDWIVKLVQARLQQLHHGGRCNQLAHRRHVKGGISGYWDSIFDVFETIALVESRLSGERSYASVRIGAQKELADDDQHRGFAISSSP